MQNQKYSNNRAHVKRNKGNRNVKHNEMCQINQGNKSIIKASSVYNFQNRSHPAQLIHFLLLAIPAVI